MKIFFKMNKEEKQKCSQCGEEKKIVFRCNFCEDAYALCRECATEHKGWCIARDDWEDLT